MIREKITEFWTICWYSKREVGDVFYLILRHKDDDRYSKKGDVKTLHVWLSNGDSETHFGDHDEFASWYSDEYMESLDVIKCSEPLLVGQLWDRDFYFKGELMTGTPTDETQPTDFIEVLMDFKQIARKINGVPKWDDEKLFFKRQDDRFTFELNT